MKYLLFCAKKKLPYFIFVFLGVALIVEYFAGLLPAVVNQITVSLRLRSLLVEWMEWRRELPIEMTLYVDDY